MECLWEAHWTSPECEESEGHQRSVGWTNRYHTVYNTYKCCTGHLFMKTAWPVSKVPLTHTHINTTYGQWAHCTQISTGGIHATYIRTHTHTLSLTRGPSLQPCVQRVTRHPGLVGGRLPVAATEGSPLYIAVLPLRLYRSMSCLQHNMPHLPTHPQLPPLQLQLCSVLLPASPSQCKVYHQHSVPIHPMHSKFAIPTPFPSLLSIRPSHLHFRDHGVRQGPPESVSPIAALLNHSTIHQPAHARVLGAALPPLGDHHSLPPVANTLHSAYNRTSCW